MNNGCIGSMLISAEFYRFDDKDEWNRQIYFSNSIEL